MWTAEEKMRCVKRELQYRIRVYARLVSEGKLTERQASREISIMAAIVEDYKELAERDSPRLDLKPATTQEDAPGYVPEIKPTATDK